MNDSETLINERFKELPLNFQKALLSFDWKAELRKISEENNLSSQQAASLEAETLLILYGFVPKENYEENLTRELSIDEVTTDKIFNAVQDRVVLVLANKIDSVSSESPLPKTEPEPLPNSFTPSISPQEKELPKPTLASVPNYSHYEPGQDPYHEPIE